MPVLTMSAMSFSQVNMSVLQSLISCVPESGGEGAALAGSARTAKLSIVRTKRTESLSSCWCASTR